jgi:hypothetical protein
MRARASSRSTAEGEHTSGLTSGLVLAYVERAGGREAVDRLLGGCGVPREREGWLRDPNAWISYALTRALYEAAADVLDDPQVMRHIGEAALDLSVGPGIHLALRALGSPRLVYQNLVRANAKFSRSHAMELLELRSDRARALHRPDRGRRLAARLPVRPGPTLVRAAALRPAEGKDQPPRVCLRWGRGVRLRGLLGPARGLHPLPRRLRGGTYVADVDLEAVFAVRLQLEPYAAGLAASARSVPRPSGSQRCYTTQALH